MLPARMFSGVPAEVVVGKGKRNIPGKLSAANYRPPQH
jgi:hypothetical protein